MLPNAAKARQRATDAEVGPHHLSRKRRFFLWQVSVHRRCHGSIRACRRLALSSLAGLLLAGVSGCKGTISIQHNGGTDGPVIGDAPTSDGAYNTAPGKEDGPGTDGQAADRPLSDAAVGIAANYPGDQGIASHPSVIFADDFESYTSADDLWDRYENVYHMEYTKFDTSFDIIGSSHNGSEMSAGYSINGTQATPGIPADGTNKYLICYECWRGEVSDPNPGLLHIYIYWPEQRPNYGDHFFPDGLMMPNTSIPQDWGPEFVPRPNVTPQLGRWYSYEVMLKANTPGQRDGCVTCWLDGEIVADFPNLRLRDIETLKIDHFSIGFHAKTNPQGPTKKWYDNLVAATEYMGPMVK